MRPFDPPRAAAGARPAAAALLSGLGLSLCFAAASALDAPRPAEAPRDAAVARGPRPTQVGPRPAPMDERRDPSVGAAEKAKRKAWNNARHRAAPGRDWRAIERENGLRKTALRQGPPRPPAVPGATWQERGSDNQAGRMHAAAPSSDGRLLYAGSDRGGVWRGSPEGADWAPIADGVFGGAHWVFASEAAEGPDRLLIATAWTGLFTSADEGGRWARPEGLPSIWQVRDLAQASDDPRVIYLLSTDYWTWHLSRSDDGGARFTLLDSWADEGSGGPGDLWAPRDGDPALYLLRGGALLRSEDRGRSFTALGALGAPAGPQRLAGSEAGAPRLYAVVEPAGAAPLLYRSDDAGAAWAAQGPIEDYWDLIEASVVDVDLVVTGGVELRVSRDGGASFAPRNAWWAYYEDPATLLHADMMAASVVPEGLGERWLIGTDGGLYDSDDGLETVRNLSLDGLRVSQYYDVLTSAADPSHVMAGSQDQGYQQTQGYEQDDAVLGFVQALSGDYGHLTSTDGSHSIVYSTYPGFLLVSVGEDEPELIDVSFPEGQNRLWLPPVVADPTDPESVFLLGDPLYRFSRAGERRWRGEVWSEQAFGSDGYETMSALSFAPGEPSRAYAATSYGRLFWSDDGGRSFTEAADRGPQSHYFYGTAIIVNEADPDEVWVGGAGYEGPAVYRSTDGGQTWAAAASGIEPTLIYGLAAARDGSGRIFAAGETGAYVYQPELDAWEDILTDGGPLTTYWAVEALPHENTLRFATYGRGIWDYQLGPVEGCYPVLDADADGVDCRTDCDEADPAVFPGAEERPDDGRDSDCDGEDNVPVVVDDEPGADGAADGGAAGAAGGADGAGDKAGCGCASGAVGGGAWAALLGVAAAGLRRPARRARA